MSKQVIVTVRRDGTVDAETIGMYGAECLDYFAVLEDLLDATVTGSDYTDDYHRVASETTHSAADTVHEEGA